MGFLLFPEQFDRQVAAAHHGGRVKDQADGAVVPEGLPLVGGLDPAVS